MELTLNYEDVVEAIEEWTIRRTHGFSVAMNGVKIVRWLERLDGSVELQAFVSMVNRDTVLSSTRSAP